MGSQHAKIDGVAGSATVGEVTIGNWALYAYPLPVTNAVKAAAVRDWATAQWQGTKANVLSWERNEAAQAARDGVADI